MNKKKKIGITVSVFVLFYIFLIFSPSLVSIPPFVFTDRSEYSLGESVTVYGFSMQPHQYASGCDSLLSVVYDTENYPHVVDNYMCSHPVGYTLPMVYYSYVWDQKFVLEDYYGGFDVQRDFVEPGTYYFYYMDQKISINIQGNSFRNTSDAIVSSVVVPPNNFVPIELELKNNSRISFFFTYDENIIINHNEKTRKPTNELLYVQLIDPEHNLLANFTGDVSSRESKISKSLSFVSELTGNYSAIITNPQNNSVSVSYAFGGVEKIQELHTVGMLE